MKVICAGMPKTGTKSMRAALTELGFDVYDFLENIQYLNREWEKIITEGGTTEDFRRMFENVDAVTDIPACYFWDEIHKAFPEAKIVFTTRDSEEDWAKSMNNQLISANHPMLTLICTLSPTLRKAAKLSDRIMYAVYGSYFKVSFFKPAEFNMLLARMTYRRHNAHVLQNAPKDKLLVYNVKEGWEPLCKFLQLPIPTTEFPHKNVRGGEVKEFLDKDPLAICAKREVMLSISLLTLIFSYGVFKLSRSSPSLWYSRINEFASILLNKISL